VLLRISRLKRLRSGGFTLVELLIVVAIFSMLLMLGSGVLVTALQSSDFRYRERLQRMQIALNQIGDDMVHGNWVTECDGFGRPCFVDVSQPCNASGQSRVTLNFYQPQVGATTPTGGGPAYLSGVALLKVRYTIENEYTNSPTSHLVREVFSQEAPGFPEEIFVRDVLVTDLTSCTRTRRPDGSYVYAGSRVEIVNSRLVVVLDTSSQGAGDPSAQTTVQGTWFVR